MPIQPDALARAQPATLARALPAAAPPKSLIITADDYGLHLNVNMAVEIAARAGGLSATSLMMAAPGTHDAVQRARDLPQLRVGLHLTLADGWSVLPQRLIPSLVDTQRRFGNRMVRDGVRFFAQRRVRDELRAEMRAQFEAFAATGLRLDHVNAHKHFHLHPTILTLLLQLAKEFGVRAVRVPMEPLLYSFKASPWGSAALGNLALRPMIQLMRNRLRRHGMFCADHVYGTARSGTMNQAALLEIIASLKPGVTEIYLHPALPASAPICTSMRKYRHAEEFAALVSPRLIAALSDPAIRFAGYRDLALSVPAQV